MAEIFVRVSPDPIDPAQALAYVRAPQFGGIVLFLGEVRSPNDGRSVERIDYSAYREMAETEIRRIAEQAAATFGAGRVWIAHRTGSVRPGETAVAIAVAAEHRDAAFGACRQSIEELKRRAPIWKHEFHDAGDRWIENRPPG